MQGVEMRKELSPSTILSHETVTARENCAGMKIGGATRQIIKSIPIQRSDMFISLGMCLISWEILQEMGSPFGLHV